MRLSRGSKLLYARGLGEVFVAESMKFGEIKIGEKPCYPSDGAACNFASLRVRGFASESSWFFLRFFALFRAFVASSTNMIHRNDTYVCLSLRNWGKKSYDVVNVRAATCSLYFELLASAQVKQLRPIIKNNDALNRSNVGSGVACERLLSSSGKRPPAHRPCGLRQRLRWVRIQES